VRAALLLVSLPLLLPASALAGSIAIVRTDNSRCYTADSDAGGALTSPSHPTGVPYSPSNAACREIGTLVDDNVFAQSASSSGGSGTASAQGVFAFDAAIDADGAVVGAHEYQYGRVSYSLDITLDTDPALAGWSLDFSHTIRGFLGIDPDTGESADNRVRAGTLSLTIGSSTYDLLGSGVVLNGQDRSCGFLGLGDCSDRGIEFFGSDAQSAVLSGAGDTSFTISVVWQADAYSAGDGAADEVSVLAGLDNVNPDQNGDNYGNWGRSVGPDGYDLVLTASFFDVPEPGAALLLVLSAAVLALRSGG
jgi:hypothetical protein